VILLHSLVSSLAKAAAAIATNTTTNGLVIDLQGFSSCPLRRRLGDAHRRQLRLLDPGGHARDGSDMADAPASAVLGAAVFAATDDNTVKSLSYVGSKRYARLKIVSTGVTTGGTLGAIAVLARQRHTGGKAV
jgi:hypothetical protein